MATCTWTQRVAKRGGEASVRPASNRGAARRSPPTRSSARLREPAKGRAASHTPRAQGVDDGDLRARETSRVGRAHAASVDQHGRGVVARRGGGGRRRSRARASARAVAARAEWPGARARGCRRFSRGATIIANSQVDALSRSPAARPRAGPGRARVAGSSPPLSNGPVLSAAVCARAGAGGRELAATRARSPARRARTPSVGHTGRPSPATGRWTRNMPIGGRTVGSGELVLSEQGVTDNLSRSVSQR